MNMEGICLLKLDNIIRNVRVQFKFIHIQALWHPAIGAFLSHGAEFRLY